MVSLGIVCVAFGVLAAAMGVFRYFYYKESGWERTTAQIVGEYTYTERGIPKLSRGFRSKSNPVTHTQARILYNVDGKVYEKTVFTKETKDVEIYYRKKDPDYFYTVQEFESRTGVWGLVAGLITGALLIAFGVALIVSNLG